MLPLSFVSDILHPPVSKNVSLGHTANFSCIAVAEFINWYVNDKWIKSFDYKSLGYEFSSTVLLDSGKSICKTTLHAKGSLLINNSSITCHAEIEHLHVQSETVFIRVQGKSYYIVLCFHTKLMFYRLTLQASLSQLMI